ncbi:hypothetical protein RP20_CCG017878 [Aedes albopictus]|nr:hypothetical protein RP20_CCG017878 [Aedes albopictus]
MTNVGTGTSSAVTQNHVGSQISQDEANSNMGTGQRSGEETSKSEGTQAGGTLQQTERSTKTTSTGTGTRTKDFSDDMSREQHDMHHNIINNNQSARRNKSKSTEDMNVDTSTMKRMLKPMPSAESPVTSPEMGRRRYNYYNSATNTPHTHQHTIHNAHMLNNNGTISRNASQSSRFSGSRSSHEIGRVHQHGPRGLYLELERERSCAEGSPPSDNVIFDNQCYATTPSSSNGNSDQDQPPYGRQGGGRHSHHHQVCPFEKSVFTNVLTNPFQNPPNVTPTPGSPTSRLLLEYEMHLRNTLAKGMDAESYSLHTFEALLSQSMENLELAESLPGSNQRSPYPIRRRSSASAKSSTLPLPHRLGPERPPQVRERERDRDRDGYYSDRNELIRERERDRDRDRGYLSDHNSNYSTANRCASCTGESARAQWFRHSDGWRSGSSTFGSGSGPGLVASQSNVAMGGHKRSPWDSLPSLRQDSSLNDSGYKSNRADSFEQRGVFDRQDSLRSDYMSDREPRYGIVQQASIDSTDSRLCYLTSSEVSTDQIFDLLF